MKESLNEAIENIEIHEGLEAISEIYEKCGKALKIDYTKCKCGYHTHCAPKQTGNVWACSDPKCAEKPRFEAFSK